MKRQRKHKLITISVFFLIYSILHVCSEHAISDIKITTLPTIINPVITTTTKKLSIPEKTEVTTKKTSLSNKTEITTSKDTLITTETKMTSQTLLNNNNNNKNDTTSTSSSIHSTKKTIEICIPPAIEQFPKPLMGPYARKHGGLIIHIIVAIFTFIGLTIVCDDYFVSSLDRICEELQLSPDVAGATFMAAGSSAPELVIAIIGVFFAKDDIGVSGVIGSAIFNTTFVIAACSLCLTTANYLNWWPLFRDCLFYTISILVLLIIIDNKKINWVESLIMLLIYGIYCIVLHMNPQLERWVMSFNIPINLPKKIDQTSTIESVIATNIETATEESNEGNALNRIHRANYNTNTVNNNENYYSPDVTNSNTTWGDDISQSTFQQQPVWDPNSVQDQQNQSELPQPPSVEDGKIENQQARLMIQETETLNQSLFKSRETKIDGNMDPFLKPTDADKFKLIYWYVALPIHFVCHFTIPNCKTEKYRNWYIVTFLVSMIWISFYSYFMVWMITIIGNTLGITDTVMGLTFIAAGVSVPDALNSIAVIKEGYGNMAISNALGSNICDILICLGLPWFIRTTIYKPGTDVTVNSKGLVYSTILLISSALFLLFATHINGWKLDKRFGIVLMVWYIILITLAALYELNFFGYMNPSECDSAY